MKIVDTEKWAPLIGRAIISFGYLESITHECIKAWTTPTISKHFQSLNLAKRIDLASDLLAHQNAPEPIKKEFTKDLKRIKQLVETRNTIAHSPLSLVIFDDTMREAIFHASNSKRTIEFEALERTVIEVEAIIERLYRNQAAIRFSNIEFYVPPDWQGIGSD